MKVRFLQRNLVTEQVVPAGLKVEVERYSKSVLGGCHEAEIMVSGDSPNLLEMLNYIRNGVELFDENGNVVWWGFVKRIELSWGKIHASVDLDEMSNKVAVAYNLISAGGSTVGIRRTTPWVTDAESIAKYGVKELLESGGSLNSVEALSMATRLRNELKYPRVLVNPGGEGGSARLECQGWWQTLGWRYCKVPTELALSFQTVGDGAVALLDETNVAQSFTPTSDINLMDVEIHVKKVGGPGDITVNLCEVDAEGKPGDSIRSGTINAHDIGATADWVRASFSETVVLVPNRQYFLTFKSTWSDESNHQVISLDPNNGYGGGDFFEKIGNNWVMTNKDMPFRLFNNVLTETSQQIQNYLTDSGQFLGRIFVNDRSGHYSESFRNGDTTTLTEIEDLLNVGTSNNRRLLARVNPDKTVDVWEQAAEPMQPLIEMRPDGRIYHRAGNWVGEHFDATGKWVSIEPVFVGALENMALAGSKCFFCDALEWSREEGIRLVPANWRNPYNVRITNG